MGITDATVSRTFTLERLAPTSEKGRVKYRASLSSEQPVRREFGIEILSHDSDAVNLERVSNGLPLLFNYNTDLPIGRVSDIRINGRRLEGALTFGRSAKTKEIQQDVDDGTLDAVSVRYSIDDDEREKPFMAVVH